MTIPITTIILIRSLAIVIINFDMITAASDIKAMNIILVFHFPINSLLKLFTIRKIGDDNNQEPVKYLAGKNKYMYSQSKTPKFPRDILSFK